jgi:putative Mg2+ transporter-C (MgtC) family protein
MYYVPLVDPFEQELLLKLIIAFAIGLIIGYERDRSGKPAGMRTQMLICVGSALLAGISIHLASYYPTANPQPEQLMAQIVTGIGFVGAGVILKTSNRINGVTTAATLWLTAAIGIGIGSGYYASSILATVFILFLEPIAAFKGYLGLKTNTYNLDIPKKLGLDAEKIMQSNFIKYHADESHDGHVQFTIFTTDQKIRKFRNTLDEKKISHNLEEIED